MSAVNVRAAALRFFGATVMAASLVAAVGFPVSAAPTRSLSVLVPIVADAGDGQLLSAEELEAETAPGGDWTLLTNSAIRHGFTLALDSRITASIAALGSDAPSSVTAWLDVVEALDPLVLPWGNSDVWALNRLGEGSMSAEQFGRIGGVDPAELVAWPSGAVVAADSVVATEQNGFNRLIVSESVLEGGYDSAASGALADAVSPDSSTTVRAGAAAVTAELDGSSTIVLPRSPEEIDVSNAIAILDQLVTPEVRVTRVVPIAVNSTRVPLTNVAGPELLGVIQETVAADEARAAAITDDIDALLTTRLRSLAVVARDFAPTTFEPAAETFINDADWLSRLISISLSTEYTVLSNQADVPVSVSNHSGATVTIDVRVRSTSGIVQVEKPTQSVTIEPRSNIRITVPMTAVANGRTALVASLVDPRGDAIGNPVPFPVEVQAQWEILTVIVFFGSVVVIMTIGILRTIRRRKSLS